MGILARLEAGKKVRAATQTSVTFDTTNHDMVRRAFGHVSSSGKAVNEQAMLSVSAAWGCRRIISEALGMLPWSMFEKDSTGNAEKADDHPLQDVLVYSPNPEQTTVEFRESLALGLTGDGNAYSLIERGARNRVVSLYPLFGVEPRRKRGSNTQLQIAENEAFFHYVDRGKPVDLPREKVWQVKGWGSDPLKGLSPLMAATQAIGGALAQEEFANRFFAKGGMPTGTVTYTGWLTSQQKIEAQEALSDMVSGLGNAHQVALFQGGMKPEPWSTMNLEEMQFIFARRFSVLEICRFYNVPPHMVAELEKGASYASIEQMSMEFLMRTLLPYITRIEDSVKKWLIPAEERRRFMLRFNYDGLLRADAKGRAEMYASAVQNGWMHRNEVRAKENLNRSDAPGMDDFTAQSNLAGIEKIVEGAVEKAVARLVRPEAPATTVQAAIMLPSSMSHQVQHDESLDRRVAGGVSEGNKPLTAAVQRTSAAQTELVSVVAGLAEKVEATHEALTHKVEAGDARVAEALASVAAGLAEQARQSEENRRMAAKIMEAK